MKSNKKCKCQAAKISGILRENAGSWKFRGKGLETIERGSGITLLSAGIL